MAAPRVGVVGHVEWVEFACVGALPARGAVVHAREWFSEAGGGGAVAAVQLRRLAGRATFLSALGDDDVAAAARRDLLDRHGVELHAAVRPGPHRRAFTHLDADGERTITVLGERIVPRGDDPLPWHALAGLDGVYFTAGDAPAVRAARAARVLVATARASGALAEAGVPVDVLVASAGDPGEQVDLARLRPAPRFVVITEGAGGGAWSSGDGRHGRWDAIAPPGPARDAYGCGDAFAAGLTYGLAAGMDIEAALGLGARCGAHCLAGRGPYGALLEMPGGAVGQSPSARRSAS